MNAIKESPQTTKEEEISWDLSCFFSGVDDHKIKETLGTVSLEADRFIKDYKGLINNKDMVPRKLLNLIKRIENITLSAYAPLSYAQLLSSSDMTNKKAIELTNTTLNAYNEIEKKMAFIELEIGALLITRREEFLNAEELVVYKHYLERIIEKYPHRLSETEEILILDKDQFGKKAWSKLQGEWLSKKLFPVVIKGEKKLISWSEVQGLYYSHDQEIRKSVMTSVMQTLGKEEEIFASCLRNIIGDHVVTSKLRKYDNSMTSSCQQNDVTQEMINNLVEVVKANVDIFQEFLQIKAKLFGTEKLQGYDLWAPHPQKEKTRIPWEEAKKMTIESYNAFDEEFGSYVKDMFNKNRIDASPRLGKRGGAFCATEYFCNSCFIMQSYNGTLDDVGTLAHELGHAVHGYSILKEQPFFNSEISMSVAETASEFGRFLLIEKLRNEVTDAEKKKLILYDHLEGLVMVIFEVGSRILFEKSLYDAYEKGIYLDGEKISKLFNETRYQFFGKNAMEFMEEQDWDWIWKPHYYMYSLRYYNYPYVFAELFVLSIFQKYKTEGKSFIPKFKKFLSAGSSQSPYKLALDNLDMDLTKKEFWELGFKEMRSILEELKSS